MKNFDVRVSRVFEKIFDASVPPFQDRKDRNKEDQEEEEKEEGDEEDEEEEENEHDLFGPLLINLTITALITIIHNYCVYHSLKGDDCEEFMYDFHFVSHVLLILFGFGIVVPVILWLILKVKFENDVELVDLISDFGYAQSAFIFLVILSMIHVKHLHFLLLAYGMTASSVFFYNKLDEHVEDEEMEENDKYILFGIAAFLQFLLVMLYEYYFFSLTECHYKKHKDNCYHHDHHDHYHHGHYHHDHYHHGHYHHHHNDHHHKKHHSHHDE